MSTTRRSGRTPGPSVSRDAVVDAALHNFAERGYRATTMTDIGDTVGLRGPSLYRHVTSKQELLAEIMLTTYQELLEEQTRAFREGKTPRDKVALFVRHHVIWHSLHRERTFVGNREIDNLEQPAKDEVLALRAAYDRRLRRVITAGRNAGDFSIDSPRLATYAILDMGMGIAQWFRPDGEFDSGELADRYAALALRLLAGSSNSGT